MNDKKEETKADKEPEKDEPKDECKEPPAKKPRVTKAQSPEEAEKKDKAILCNSYQVMYHNYCKHTQTQVHTYERKSTCGTCKCLTNSFDIWDWTISLHRTMHMLRPELRTSTCWSQWQRMILCANFLQRKSLVLIGTGPRQYIYNNYRIVNLFFFTIGSQWVFCQWGSSSLLPRSLTLNPPEGLPDDLKDKATRIQVLQGSPDLWINIVKYLPGKPVHTITLATGMHIKTRICYNQAHNWTPVGLFSVDDACVYKSLQYWIVYALRLLQSRSLCASFYVVDVTEEHLKDVVNATGISLQAGTFWITHVLCTCPLKPSSSFELCTRAQHGHPS